jgi:hypothetical protein
MLQHFLRRVREKNWRLFVKSSRDRPNPRDSSSGVDLGCVRLSIEFENMQTAFVLAQDVEFGSMQLRTAGQNATQTIQDGLDRGLIGYGIGKVQQSSISLFGSRHDTPYLLRKE